MNQLQLERALATVQGLKNAVQKSLRRDAPELTHVALLVCQAMGHESDIAWEADQGTFGVQGLQ